MNKNFLKNKTGKEELSTMGNLIILLVFIAIFSLVFFGFKGLFSKSDKTLHTTVDENKPGGGVPDIGGSGTGEASKLKSELSQLASSVNSVGGKDKCLVYISELEGIDDKHFVRLEKNKAKLMEESDKPGGLPLAIETEVLTNFVPCRIKDEDALRFYNCYLKPGSKTCNDPPISPINDETLEIDFTNSNKYKFLFKSGSFFCAFEFYDDASCQYSEGKLAKGCQSMMPYFENSLSRCDDLEGKTNLEEPEDNAKEDAKKILNAVKIGQESSANFCFVPYEPIDTFGYSTEANKIRWKIGMSQEGPNLHFYQVDSGGRYRKLLDGLADPTIASNLCLIEGTSKNQILRNNVEMGLENPFGDVSKKRFAVGYDGGNKYKITVGGPYDDNAQGDNYKAYFNQWDNRYLYKIDHDNICFFTLRTDADCSCYPSKNEGIDDDCFSGSGVGPCDVGWIASGKLLTCSEKEKHPFKQGLTKGGYTKEFIEKSTEFYDGIIEAKGSSKEICRAKLSKYPGFDNQRIKMLKNGNTIKLNAEGDSKPVVEFGVIDNYMPCIVDADKFVKWIKEGNMGAKNSQFVNKDDIIIKGTGGNGMASSPPPANYDLFEDNPVLYKTGEGHICLIPTFNDFDPWGNDCKAEGNKVDNDCLRPGKEFENNVELC